MNLRCDNTIDVMKMLYHWPVNNFSFILSVNCDHRKSPRFGANNECSFLLFSTKKPSVAEYEYSDICLTFCFHFKLNTQVTITIRNSKHELIKKQIYYLNTNKHETFINAIEAKILKDQLPDDKLVIYCELCYDVTIVDNPTLLVPTTTTNESTSAAITNLIADFSKMMANTECSDVTLSMDGSDDEEKNINVHKVILMARSPVFSSMFTHNMEESRTNKVVIVDVDHDVVEEMIRFLYTGTAPKLGQMAHRLFIAADKVKNYYFFY